MTEFISSMNEEHPYSCNCADVEIKDIFLREGVLKLLNNFVRKTDEIIILLNEILVCVWQQVLQESRFTDSICMAR